MKCHYCGTAMGERQDCMNGCYLHAQDAARRANQSTMARIADSLDRIEHELKKLNASAIELRKNQ